MKVLNITPDGKVQYVFETNNELSEKLLKIGVAKTTRLNDIVYTTKNLWTVVDNNGNIIHTGFKTYSDAVNWEIDYVNEKLLQGGAEDGDRSQ